MQVIITALNAAPAHFVSHNPIGVGCEGWAKDGPGGATVARLHAIVGARPVFLNSRTCWTLNFDIGIREGHWGHEVQVSTEHYFPRFEGDESRHYSLKYLGRREKEEDPLERLT